MTEKWRAAWESHPPDHSESVVLSHRTAHTELESSVGSVSK